MNASARQRWFTAMYQEHYSAVLAYSRRRVGEARARDITAEVFMTAWRRMDDLPDPVLPWLITTASFVTANDARGNRRGDRLVARLAAMEPGEALPDHASYVVGRQHVIAALNTLTVPDRELLLLIYWDGLSIASAATVVSCTPAAARVRLHRARRRLRRLLAEPSEATVPEPTPSLCRPLSGTEAMR